MQENEDISRFAELHRQALQRNEEAKVRFQKLNEYGQDLNARLSRQSGSSKEQSLISHLENIRLQRQYTKLQTLSHYSARIEAVAKDDGIYEALPLLLPGEQDHDRGDTTASQAQDEVNRLLKHAKALTTDIELALVKARLSLKHEQSLLRELQHAAGNRSIDKLRSEALPRLRALEATRDELQRWVEESLAQCEQIDGEKLNGQDSDVAASEDQQAQIEVAYEMYLEKRKRLVEMVRSFEHPASDTATAKERPSARSTPSTERQSRHLQPAAQLRQYRRSSSHVGEISGPPLAEVQNVSLPRYQHEKLLGNYLSHVTGQTHAQDLSLLQSLGRLSHESHLLPIYPHTISQGERLDPGLTRRQGEVHQLLRAWAYASDAAAQVRTGNIESQAAEAKESLQQAELDVQELLVMEDMRREVLRMKTRNTT